MSWQQLAVVDVVSNWISTPIVEGNLFKFEFSGNSINSKPFRAAIAQVFQDEGETNYLYVDSVNYKQEKQLFQIIKPKGLGDRQLAIRRLDNLIGSWTIKISVFAGSEDFDLPINISDVTNLQVVLDSKALESELVDHSEDINNPHQTTYIQVGAEPAGTAVVAVLAHEETTNHPLVTDTAKGMMAALDKTKLDNIEPGATANSTDAELRDRSTHTGTQNLTTITGLEDALADKAEYIHGHEILDVAGLGDVLVSKVDSNDARLTNARTPTGAASGDLAGTYPNPTLSNTVNAQLRDRSTHTGTQPASTISDFAEVVDDRTASLILTSTPLTKTYDDVANSLTIGISNASTTASGAMSATDKSKLDGVAPGATTNSTDANLRDRSTHTGTQLAGTISNFIETVDDRVANLILTSSPLTKTYDDVANTLTIAISNASTTVSGAMSATDKTKLDGVATGATANSTDAQLRDRSTHTGTQLSTTPPNGDTSNLVPNTSWVIGELARKMPATPGVFGFSKNLSNGIIEQWGQATLTSSNGTDYSATVNFPTTFITSVFNIIPTAVDGDIDIRLIGQIKGFAPNNSTVTFLARNNVNASGSSLVINYRAIGN